MTRGRIVGYSADHVEVVFDEPVAPGKYVIAIYTRYGNGEGYRAVRISRKIRAV